VRERGRQKLRQRKKEREGERERERKRDNSTFALKKNANGIESILWHVTTSLYTTYVDTSVYNEVPQKKLFLYLCFSCSKPFSFESGEYSNFGTNVFLKDSPWLFRITCHGFLVTCNATLCKRNKNIPPSAGIFAHLL